MPQSVMFLPKMMTRFGMLCVASGREAWVFNRVYVKFRGIYL
jgi:hypothetical protein